MLFANFALRMLSTTLIVKSKSTLSILCNALNHAPERIALVFRFTSCFLLRKKKVLTLDIAFIVGSPFWLFSITHLHMIFMNYALLVKFNQLNFGTEHSRRYIHGKFKNKNVSYDLCISYEIPMSYQGNGILRFFHFDKLDEMPRVDLVAHTTLDRLPTI